MTEILDKNISQKSGFYWPAQASKLPKAFEIFCHTVFRFYCPLKVSGLENLPKTHPFLLVSNHSSHMDSVLLMAAAGLSFYETGLIAAKDYFFDERKRGFLHKMLNLVPIERGSKTKSIDNSLKACESFLSLPNAKALVIFPEGTRSITGKLGRFKEGGFVMAHKLNIPIVPAYIHNARRALPKGSYMIRKCPITVTFQKPFKVQDFLPDKSTSDRKELLEAYRQAALNAQTLVSNMQESFYVPQ